MSLQSIKLNEAKMQCVVFYFYIFIFFKFLNVCIFVFLKFVYFCIIIIFIFNIFISLLFLYFYIFRIFMFLYFCIFIIFIFLYFLYYYYFYIFIFLYFYIFIFLKFLYFCIFIFYCYILENSKNSLITNGSVHIVYFSRSASWHNQEITKLFTELISALICFFPVERWTAFSLAKCCWMRMLHLILVPDLMKTATRTCGPAEAAHSNSFEFSHAANVVQFNDLQTRVGR